MTQQSTILGLLAQTSLHAGTGQNTGIIDLPIQREGHNGWPCVFGSAVKGAMRARAEEWFKPQQENHSINRIFGPNSQSKSKSNIEYASAIMISDARIILFPVRSLTSQFKWVTCPSALERLQRDMQRFSVEDKAIETISITNDDIAIVHKRNSDTSDRSLFLEEYRFQLHRKSLDKTIELLAKLMPQDNAQALLEQQLVILHDDSFTYLVNHATPVNAHIAIDSEHKTVKQGALWYEETLPSETLLYVGLNAVDDRNGGVMSAENVLSSVLNLFAEKPWLQLGGNETVGMGWCAVCDYSAKEK
jgi:CRISPR-associated protein Cmr4